MKNLCLSIMLFLLAYSVFAKDLNANNCEIFVDKVVPIKVYFDNRNTVYTKLELYVKIHSSFINDDPKVAFYAEETLYHSYGTSPKLWTSIYFERIADDYFKLSLEVAGKNHSVHKFSNSRSYTGNFYVEINNEVKFWAKLDGNISLSTTSVERLPIKVHWLNDGMYDLESMPTTASVEGYMRSLNPTGCR